uniref:Uncharacterized protein n=1 Tax=Mesocestoides corti TaxID=53468 RepID=A0A5K3FYB9_MESCO
MDDESFLQVYKSKVPRQLIAWATILPDVGCGDCRNGYLNNHEHSDEPNQKLRTALLLRGRQCGDGSGRRNIGPCLSQPALCLSAFQWHARKINSQPDKNTNEEQYITSDVASVVDSGGRCLMCASNPSPVLTMDIRGKDP